MTLDTQLPGSRTAPSAAALLAALEEVLPRRAILTGREDTTPYECDGLTAYRATPLAVVIPETEQEVGAALRVCHRLRVPVVARGAGTGLSGGATPLAAGVILSLARLNNVIRVDPVSECAQWRSRPLPLQASAWHD